MNIHTASSHPPAALRTGPFADALRAAITARGLSLDSLQRHLADRGVRVGTATLSCWQNGRRRPERPDSLRAVSALEDILNLPTGSLLVLLGPPRPRGHGVGLPAGSREYRHIIPTWAALTDLLSSLGTSADTKLHIAAQHETIWLDATGSSPRRETFQILRAHQDSVDRYVAIVDADPGADISRVDVEAMENCRVGRIRRDQTAGLLVAELLFDLTLRPNQTHLIRYAVTDHSAVECTDFHRGFRFPAGQYALQVRFTPEKLPVACFAYQGTAEHELPMTGHHAVHINLAPVPPGIVGIRWDWQ